MLIIETASVTLPRFKRFTSQSVTGGPNNYTCFAMLGVCITFVDDAKAFRDAVRRYAQDDWSEHRQVRIEKKKARSKARAQQRGYVADELKSLRVEHDKQRDARFAAEKRANEHYKTIQAMKITFEELRK